MMSAFNPYTAGAAPQSPNIQLDTVAHLLGGAGAGVQSLVNGIQKSQEISRSSKVNDILASGGLQGLTEEQQRQKLAQMTGGQSINPLVQANVADVMANQKANEMAKASAAAALGLEDRKSSNDMAIEELKAKVGMNKDIAVAKTKGEIESEAAKLLYGNNLNIQNLKGSQAQGLAKLENDLKNESFKQNLDPTRFTVIKDGDKAYAVDKSTGIAKELSTGINKSSKDLVKDLPAKAEEFVRGLSPNQRKNWEKAYKNGNLAWQDEKTEKVLNKAGLAENKVISSGRFVDLNNPTAAWVTFSNKLEEEQ